VGAHSTRTGGSARPGTYSRRASPGRERARQGDALSRPVRRCLEPAINSIKTL